MSVIFNSRTEEHDNSVFFEKFFKFFFPSFESICFIGKQKRNKLTDILLIKIQFIGYGFSDGFADHQIFLEESFKDFLSADMADVENFAYRICIIHGSVFFE